MAQDVSFGRYRFNLASGQLWAGRREIKLTPKASSVLVALVTRAGHPVTKDELFAAVWPDAIVSDEALTSCVQELRKALADDARRPRFIETRHRRGYRFVARVSASPIDEETKAPGARGAVHSRQVMVGRERELQTLHAWFERAAGGERQIVFVTGEPGIGKTTFVEAFVEDTQRNRVCRIGQGRCIDHYGAGEAYLPILEALTRLCRESGRGDLVRLLRRHAPSWLAQMPSLLAGAELETLTRRTAGVTRERMLRELADAVEAAAADQPLVLWLEDLHWSDRSTLDWLAYIGRRPGPARLLLIGAYRSADVTTRPDSLMTVKTELEVQGRCRELALSPLNLPAIEEYITRRFPTKPDDVPPLMRIASELWQRTDGNPLFLINVAADLVARGVLVVDEGFWRVAAGPAELSIPEDITRMIDGRLDQLHSDERRLLEAASVAGEEFSSAAIAAALELAVDEADASCAELARREAFLVARGDERWPDGTAGGRYGFRHALYQEVLYRRVPGIRRAALHHRIGARIETAFRDRWDDVAPALALHFRRADDVDRGVQYLARAGAIASRRGAACEAVAHLTDAIALLNTQPESADRKHREIELHIALGPSLMALEGWGAPAVERAYVRAQDLCEEIGDTPQLFRALWGVWQFRTNRAEFDASRTLGQRLLEMARLADESGVILEAHHALWTCCFLQGDLVGARDHITQGIELYDHALHASLASVYGNHDPGVCCRAIGAWVLELLGEGEMASQWSDDAIALARTLGHPFSEAHALIFAAFLYRERRDPRRTRLFADKAAAIAHERGFALLAARAAAMRGWATSREGEAESGVQQMQDAIGAIRKVSASFIPYFLACLADGCRQAGRTTDALETVTEALSRVEATGERFYAAELLCVRGELMIEVHRDRAAAQASFRSALECAGRQHARRFEIRALDSLGAMVHDRRI
jgi:predicted ATPase